MAGDWAGIGLGSGCFTSSTIGFGYSVYFTAVKAYSLVLSLVEVFVVTALVDPLALTSLPFV